MKLALSLFLGAISATATSGITIPSVSKADALAYEGENAKRNGFTFAKQKKVSIDTSTDGTWDSEARTWTMDVTSYGASNLNFGLTNYKLPYNAILTIRCNLKDSSIDCEDVPPIRVIGSKQNSKSKEYWTPILDCDAVIIELKYDTNYNMTTAPIDFILSYINIGFKSIGGGDKVDTKSADCNVDVVCDESVGWEREIRSVATVTIRGVGTCSGSMINNMDEDRTPYFLTAAHCQIERWNAPSLVIYWNYENSKCGGRRDGSKRKQSQSGAVHLKSAKFPGSGVYGDAALVKLKRSPNDSWKVTFAGWDNSPDAYKKSPGVCIHHPGGNEKKISTGNGTMAATGFYGNRPDGTHVSIVWDVGTTERGSSGSPLFNGAHRIIGQLHGGPTACGNKENDYFGRFSLAYQVLNFAKWLDPNNVLNGTFGGIDTYDPYWFVETNKYACLRDASDKKVGTVFYRWQKKGNKYRMILSAKMTDLKSKDFKVSVDISKKCRRVMFTKNFKRRNPFNYNKAKYEYEENKKFVLILKPTGNGSTPERNYGRTIIVSDANNDVVGCGIIADSKKFCQ